MLTAAIYARYSSALQQPSSIEDQIALCRGASQKFGCTVLEDHLYSDAGLSGTIDQRPAYRRLITAAKLHAFDAIIVEAQDRLWRDLAEMHHALKRLRHWGIRVFSVATGNDLTDETGKLVAAITGLKDEVFIEDLSRKTRRGMIGRVAQGFSVGGRSYGYRSAPVYDPVRKDSYGNPLVVGYKRVIDEGEAEIVRRIFVLYVQGTSPKTIGHMLNAEHVPPPRVSRGRTPLGWTWTTIAGAKRRALGILHNPLYAGRLVWNRSQKVRDPDTGRRTMRARPQTEWVSTEVPELRIIPNDLWEAAQARSDHQRATAKGNLKGRRPKYVLSGLLTCAECGSNYTITKGRYYGCAAHADRGPYICTNSRLATRERLEQVILKAIFEEVFAPETLVYLSQKVNEALANASMPADKLRKKRQAELARAREELENIQTAIRQGILTPTTRDMLIETEQRIVHLETGLQASAEKPTVVYLPSVVEACLRDLMGTLETDPDHARALIARLIGKITLRAKDGHLWAEMRGNIAGILEVDDQVGNAGAGRGIRELANWRPVPFVATA